ncbi:cardiolipin synthase [Guptibacillus hwajinpoensis]|uniref:Cardiolipin synthase n=1 Tax=Guptibacillus hwajinpoensis TaxID=208199 RepID=A0A0J6CU82_9BACL|nr:cardiolipin synthase [Alkalihalobacillus macyae]KMM36620.1 hypothetical protein AB986_11675 [Alkalihalobacillus macyae]
MRFVLALILAIIIWIAIDLILGSQKRRHVPSSSKLTMHGNIEFIADGEDFFEMLLEDVDKANQHIHMMFYIFRDDETGKKFIHNLCQKASSGVSVYVLADYVGSHGLKKSTIEQMTSCGVHFSFSRKIQLPFLFSSINNRNHRKITVIDGKIGYVGGFNVGDEYAGRKPKFGYWRDYHLRVTGEAVKGLQEQFLIDWKADNTPLEEDETFYPTLPKGETEMKYHITNGSGVKESFADYINKATTSIIIGSPYFIPGHMVQDSLVRAIRRGVSVKLILPMRADHPLVKEASYHYLVELLEEGGEVYQYMNGFYHAKVMIVDNRICDIGTANFDKRSFHINSEINCIFESSEVLSQVMEVINSDFIQSERLDLARLKKRTISNKFISPFARLLSPFL